MNKWRLEKDLVWAGKKISVLPMANTHLYDCLISKSVDYWFS